MITEMVADQVAPSYWVPNKDVMVRTSLPLVLLHVTVVLFHRHASCVNFISVSTFLNTIVEVSNRPSLVLHIDGRIAFSLACGHVFCDTCTTNRRIVPWIDTETPVRVCTACFDYPASQAPTSIPQSSSPSSKKSYSGKSYENGSSGESASIVSSGEHLNDLCLSPTDIFDIEQPGAGKCASCALTTLLHR